MYMLKIYIFDTPVFKLPSNSSPSFFSCPLFNPSLHRRAILLKHKCDYVLPVLRNFSDTPCPLYMANKILHNRNSTCLWAFSHPIAHPSFSPLSFSLLHSAIPHLPVFLEPATRFLTSALDTLCFFCSSISLCLFL